MINWTLYINSYDDEAIELTQGKTIEIKETDKLVFFVEINKNTLNEVGTPQLLIGDIPVEFCVEKYTETCVLFKTQEEIYSNRSRYFYNFFGESEVRLFFDRDDEKSIQLKFNILARRENALLAKDMLDYLTSRIDDAVSICFSRSHINASYSENDKFNFNKYILIEKTINFLKENLTLFVKENRHTWETDIVLSETGQPTGPDSVLWVLSNLDKISLSNGEDVNVFYNNRGYSLPLIPKEIIKKDTDTYENRVINAFLFHSKMFLDKLKAKYLTFCMESKQDINNEYVRFDHTMSQYMNIAVQYKIRNVNALQRKLDVVHKIFNKLLPSKVVKDIHPKFTPYVNRHYHYREVFSLITKCLSSPSPKFDGSELLLGLKNLAIIYELTTLISLNDIFSNDFSLENKERSYRLYSDEFPFGGKLSVAPSGVINNFFSFEGERISVEVFYEPKIFPFKEFNKPGDLINTSNKYASKEYGEYHICPDFIVKLSSKFWREPLLLIIDAKYKDSNSVKEYDFDRLTLKYLLNIHRVNDDSSLSNSYAKMLVILFAHPNRGLSIRSVSRDHLIVGKHPVLPQTIALHFNPLKNDILVDHITASINYMHNRDG